MIEILKNIIAFASNVFIFLTAILMIVYIPADQLAQYYYTLSVYIILSLITSLYFSKTSREMVLSRAPDSDVSKYILTVIFLGMFVSAFLSIITTQSIGVFVNFWIWHVIDYTNSLLLVRGDNHRHVSVIIPRLLRFAIILYLTLTSVVIFETHLETFMILGSTMPLLAFMIINRKYLGFRGFLIPSLDRKNLGNFIGDVFGTIQYSIDNIIMKDLKEYSAVSFANINYLTMNLKYLVGIFHGITYPFVLQSYRDNNYIPTNILLLHTLTPLLLYVIGATGIYFIFSYFLDIQDELLDRYIELSVSFLLLNITHSIRTLFIALDYKKPLGLAETLYLIVLVTVGWYVLDPGNPYSSYIEYIKIVSTVLLFTYLLLFLLFLRRFVKI
ncbi:MAG: hypothetical protein NZ908_01060 [Candidatus Micrarchaeota archaeon]|nr:hypothetical protein [Candidatus Micrarchaeota archaeon]MCX8154778.1 hypothetical protein [Candidatus Micrarchaeota archaeon]